MVNKIENFVQRFMDKEEISIHHGILNSEFVQELDRKIEKGPHATRKFYQDYSDNLSDTLGLKKEIARLITHFFSTLVSMYEIGRLSIVGAETTKLKMTANTASVTAYIT
ncbi:hypothetical protein HRED_08920 [Candidatus Haloredivivus sp. G17]|nr:hypothetical protein HRED_08920 [Candidatus Haloredivivus sp. G17]